MFIQEKRRRDGQPMLPPPSSEIAMTEDSVPTQKHFGYRSTFQSILSKSPSMSKLHHVHNHLSNHRAYGTASSDLHTATTPMTSPPSLDRTFHPSIRSIAPASLAPPSEI